eukprot:gene11908-15894_t
MRVLVTMAGGAQIVWLCARDAAPVPGDTVRLVPTRLQVYRDGLLLAAAPPAAVEAPRLMSAQHVPLAFDLPDGITRISGQFVATPKRAQGAEFDNLISLSVFGPKGSRGARHNNPAMDFSIDAMSATPGYLPGAIEAGRWMVFLDTFRVLGPDPVHYTLTVTLETERVAPRASYDPAAVAGRGRGWYRGDLHAHTLHSDGRWDVPDLAAWARSRGLDFMTLSDHNTVSGQAQLRSLAGDDLLVMGGMELTTHAGHALSLGGSDWHEWRSGPATGKTMPMLA